METPADLQTEWARLVIDGLVHAGVRDAVISPGSRSTPFTCAAIDHAELNCVSGWDERSAAHYALGQARASGRPSLVICTSGSAAANYFPAVVEAFEAGVPLVVLTADRPAELHGCGANQTTDQIHLFGRHARFFANLGEPSSSESALRGAYRAAVRAVEHAIGVPPGPVHVNAPARKPLEPSPSPRGPLHDMVRTIRETEPDASPVAPSQLDVADVDVLRDLMAHAERGLLLLGPLGAQLEDARGPLVRLAEHSGFAIAAESPSQMRHFDGASRDVFGGVDLLWRTPGGRELYRPDVVVQFGETPTGPGWLQYRRAVPGTRHVVVHPWKNADPTRQAERVWHADVANAIARLAEGTHSAKSSEWRQYSAKLDARVQACRDSMLAGDTLSEAAVAVEAMKALPDQSALVLGNSLPVRQIDMWTGPTDKCLRVFTQRGVSGIDGVLSGAAGAASKTDVPTLVLLGDVSFLHDINGLQLAARARTPLVVLVVNNYGGQIFRQLPIGESEDALLDYFTTPHDFSLAHASGLYGVLHHVVTERGALSAQLDAALQRNGCTVIEAQVPPNSAAQDNKRLLAAVETALRQA